MKYYRENTCRAVPSLLSLCLSIDAPYQITHRGLGPPLNVRPLDRKHVTERTQSTCHPSIYPIPVHGLPGNIFSAKCNYLGFIHRHDSRRDKWVGSGSLVPREIEVCPLRSFFSSTFFSSWIIIALLVFPCVSLLTQLSTRSVVFVLSVFVVQVMLLSSIQRKNYEKCCRGFHYFMLKTSFRSTSSSSVSGCSWSTSICWPSSSTSECSWS